MLTIFNSYIPPLWNVPQEKDLDDVPPHVEGDLVEFDSWDCQLDENDEVVAGYQGCGIIHYFTRAEFKNLQTGKFEFKRCAVIVSANPDTDWHDFVPLENLNELSLSDYVSFWELEYGELSQENRLQLRITVATRMQRYSRIGDNSGRMSNMPNGDSIVPFPHNHGGTR